MKRTQATKEVEDKGHQGEKEKSFSIAWNCHLDFFFFLGDEQHRFNNANI